tara:strand:+ start:113 stop:583 length:471 start_codon:yes stop_codon:yes gene_type:complete
MKLLIIVLFIQSFSLFAQDLTKQRIWKISSKKRAVFLDKGVFFTDSKSSSQQLKGIRNSYVPSRGYERVVFDFSSAKPPRVYGHIASKEKKVYIDLHKTSLNKAIEAVKNVKFVKNVDFFNLDIDNLSVELSFKEKVSFDIFYLENPGRLVIDVKK